MLRRRNAILGDCVVAPGFDVLLLHCSYILSFCNQNEATEVFFATTKLFQSKDIGLRRMVYLMIKEISPSSDEVG